AADSKFYSCHFPPRNRRSNGKGPWEAVSVIAGHTLPVSAPHELVCADASAVCMCRRDLLRTGWPLCPNCPTALTKFWQQKSAKNWVDGECLASVWPTKPKSAFLLSKKS